ncbi:uncharacterized protein MAM_00352 [Metarhizium album ARSEF 1941]|uniref:Uncharacterized protein n=1 Tax=Metarhizium album (strain ARSEF 1941) TaxID=1081103 RepID=A0A0B2X7T9_METAS|nr:uncharacterized protein MAM_00352 [Metarhizium album ARSEF 1941]KHO01351.1 hypothetical protein MAM_00352 [Metarhizium album ARSEF 1941]
MSLFNDKPEDTGPIVAPRKLLLWPSDWQDWYWELREHCRARKLWDDINPNLPEQETDSFPEPQRPTADEARALFNKYRHDIKNWTITEASKILDMDYDHDRADWIRKEDHVIAIRGWFSVSIERNLYMATCIELERKNPNYTIRQLVKALKAQLAPAQSSVQEKAF